MNFLSSYPSVEGTVEWDGLQLQARTSQPLGRDDVCTAAHCFYVPALQQVAARNTSRVRHPRALGVRPGYTIALGTEKVQTEVQKQSEGSGNRG